MRPTGCSDRYLVFAALMDRVPGYDMLGGKQGGTMFLTLDEERHACCWDFTVRLDELARLLKTFNQREPSTRTIELQAERLVKDEFQSPDDLREFIKAVCKWRGYEGIAGRVLNSNTESDLSSCFRSAHSHAIAHDDLAAIKSLLGLDGIAISFASKHLKFLVPENAVVLDSIISKRLGYELTTEGYHALLTDCRRILEKAVSSRLDYPGWGRDGWRVSDIEMAIFEKLRA
jgi:hypothetical protein